MATPGEPPSIDDSNRWTVLAVTMVGIAASFPITALVMIVRPLMFAAGALIGGRQQQRMGGRRVVMLGMASVGNAVPDEDLGVASGSLNTMGMIGTSIGVTMFTAALGDARSGDAFFWVYVGTAVAALLALAAGSRLGAPGQRRLRGR